MADFELTDEQLAILQYLPGRHARILAGPGTGKSATVVQLIDQLLSTDQSPKVRLLTFTRAATAELAGKVADHPAAAQLQPSTIHSFSLSVLLQNRDATSLPWPLRIADDWERKNIVNLTLARRIGVQPRRIDDLFRELAANWESLEPEESTRVRAEDRARFLASWAEHRGVFGYTMLSELPFGLREALLQHNDLAGIDFDLLVVDEYQDLNACDLHVLRLLADRGCWVIAVGDDDQSIYSFRRAAPQGIRRFPDDYDGHAEFPLSITHRCGSRIVAWASHVIEGDLSRGVDRRRLTPSETSPPGTAALLSFRSAQAEARGVADIAQKLINDLRIPAAEILVLLRTDHNGAWSEPIKAALDERGVPYSDPDQVSLLLSEPHNRRFLALLRLMVNPSDSLAWVTLLQAERGIGPAFLDRIYESARSNRTQFGAALRAAHEQGFEGFSPAAQRRCSELLQLVDDQLQNHPVPEVVQDGAWGQWIAVWAHECQLDAPSDTFLNLLCDVDQMMQDDTGLDRYLGQLAPLGRDMAQARSEGIRIMSMAASKGLTVEATILPGLEDGVVPRPDADINEERRLLYVAMTRAKQFLFGTWAQRRQGPTARSGRARVQQRRTPCEFLRGGPVETTPGQEYIAANWR